MGNFQKKLVSWPLTIIICLAVIIFFTILLYLHNQYSQYNLLVLSLAIILTILSIYGFFIKKEDNFTWSKIITTGMTITIGVASIFLPFYLFQIQERFNDVNIKIHSAKFSGIPLDRDQSHTGIISTNLTISNEGISTTMFTISKNQGSGQIKNIYITHFQDNNLEKPIINDINTRPISWGTSSTSSKITFLPNNKIISCLNANNSLCTMGISFHIFDLFSHSSFFMVIEGENGSKQYIPILIYSAGYTTINFKENTAYYKVKSYIESEFITEFSLDVPKSEFFSNVLINNNISEVCKVNNNAAPEYQRILDACQSTDNNNIEQRYSNFKNNSFKQLAKTKEIFNFK